MNDRSAAPRAAGFTLIELMIVVTIVGVLAMIAYPSYVNSIARSKRVAAEACMSTLATHMERFYTTNLRYDQTTGGTAMNTAALQALGVDCASAANTGADYTYSFAAGTPTAATYTLQAAPTGAQATRDARCGTLTLTQAGVKTASGSAGTSQCW